MTRPVDLVFTAEQYARLHAHLFQNSDEQAAYAFASYTDGHETLRLLVHHLVLLTPEDFIEQSGVYLEVKPDIAARITEHALEGTFSLIEIHSHPFADADVAFSETDTRHALPRFRWFAEQLAAQPQARAAFHHAMLVLGVSSADALYYDRAADRMIPARRVLVLDAPLRMLPVTAYAGKTAAEPAYQHRVTRQIAAFGAEGQARLAELRVGIVGLGGIGGLLAHELALLGVRRFVLVDGDVLEMSNLNRFIGGTHADVEARRLKIDVIAHAISGIDPGAHVTQHAVHLPDAAAAAALRDCDVLFGCTDNHGSRLILNTLSVQYLLPYIDIGTGIFTDGAGTITEAGGQYRVLLPGRLCMACIDAIDPDAALRDLLPPDARAQHRARGYIPTEDVPAPSVIFLNALLASLAVGELLNLIAPYRVQTPILYYFMQTQELRRVEAVRNPGCAVCGAGGRLAMGDLDDLPGIARPGSAIPAITRQDDPA
jgi:molybdopterin/thiamine biosynthesis adenylyltransferase